MSANETNIATTKVQAPVRREPTSVTPLRALGRLADEVTRIFDDFGLGHASSAVAASSELMTWTPRVDVTQHKDELVIRFDLPGVDKSDVKVNVADDAITIAGERHRAQEEESDGVYRTERSYGAFYRTIALPAGVVTDSAKASFNNGVLEIRMPAAAGAEGRPLEIA